VQWPTGLIHEVLSEAISVLQRCLNIGLQTLESDINTSFRGGYSSSFSSSLDCSIPSFIPFFTMHIAVVFAILGASASLVDATPTFGSLGVGICALKMFWWKEKGWCLP
jgi:hypothetical protein